MPFNRHNSKPNFPKVLNNGGVTLIAGGVDEDPVAYKDLEEVMNCRQGSVETIGKLTPKIVRMDKNQCD